MLLVAIILLIMGMLDENAAWLLTSGLFAIAGAITNFTYKYFKNR